MTNSEQIAIVNGEPEAVMSAAGVAQIIRISPLGATEAFRRLKLAVSPEHFALIKKEYDNA